MRLPLVLGLITLCSAPGASSASEDALIDAAQQDLAQRLRLNVEAVTVAPNSGARFLEAAVACERRSAPVKGDAEDGETLILVAEGNYHYYHARKGESYTYCELPSTKKRGPIGPPIR